MSQQTFDPSSHWMLEVHGASLLYLAGLRNIVSCQARKGEVVQPRKYPDGLLEVRFAREAKPSLVLVEVATYPEKRVVKQMQDGIRLVRQVRGVLPEAVVVCLSPKGTYQVPEQVSEKSKRGWTAETLSWKVVELWTLSAEYLLEAPDVGVVVWACLARFDGPPQVLLQRCRDRIDREDGKQRENLLAVAQVLARLHFDKPEWMEILGGRKMMIESPLLQEIVAESARAERVKAITTFLQGRFKAMTPTITAGLEQVKEEEKLHRLTLKAATCKSLQAFENALLDELPKPPPASTRGKRRSRKPEE
jgi:predicted transposase YdaD